MACSDGPRTGVGVWRLVGVTVEVLVTPQKAEETGYSAGRLPCAADSPLSHTPNGDVIGCEEKESGAQSAVAQCGMGVNRVTGKVRI